MKHEYAVIVGNIGYVHEGSNYRVALSVYASYVRDSKANKGRAGGESVTLMVDHEPEKEYIGKDAEAYV